MTEPSMSAPTCGFLDYLNAMPGPKMHEARRGGARQQYVAMQDVADPPIGDLADDPRPDDPRPRRRDPGPAVRRAAQPRARPGARLLPRRRLRDRRPRHPRQLHAPRVARALDLPVIAVDYRLAPEAKWPAAPDDCEAAARWVAGSPAELGRSVTSLVLMGDSAGGNLTIVTAMALRDRPAAVPVIAQIADLSRDRHAPRTIPPSTCSPTAYPADPRQR